MRKFTQALCAATVAMSFAVASFVPATAAPIVVPNVATTNGVIDVQTRMIIEEMQQPGYRQLRREYRDDRRDYRQDRRDVRRSGFYREGGGYYYNGHRGYRSPRPGYRNHNGFWFPAGAFIAGAIIGGALNNPAPVYRGTGNAHVQWCHNRWRSYRAYDNTYQPYNGPRQQCYSPYS